MIWPKAVGGLRLCLRRDDLDRAISERVHHVLSWLLLGSAIGERLLLASSQRPIGDILVASQDPVRLAGPHHKA